MKHASAVSDPFASLGAGARGLRATTAGRQAQQSGKDRGEDFSGMLEKTRAGDGQISTGSLAGKNAEHGAHASTGAKETDNARPTGNLPHDMVAQTPELVGLDITVTAPADQVAAALATEIRAGMSLKEGGLSEPEQQQQQGKDEQGTQPTGLPVEVVLLEGETGGLLPPTASVDAAEEIATRSRILPRNHKTGPLRDGNAMALGDLRERKAAEGYLRENAETRRENTANSRDKGRPRQKRDLPLSSISDAMPARVLVNRQERHILADGSGWRDPARQLTQALDGALSQPAARAAREGTFQANQPKVVRQLNIQLYPKSLGTITAKMVLVDGKLEIALVAPSAHVAEHLRKNVEQLSRQIRAEDPSLQKVTIHIETDMPAPLRERAAQDNPFLSGNMADGRSPNQGGGLSDQEKNGRASRQSGQWSERHEQGGETELADLDVGDDALYL